MVLRLSNGKNHLPCREKLAHNLHGPMTRMELTIVNAAVIEVARKRKKRYPIPAMWDSCKRAEPMADLDLADTHGTDLIRDERSLLPARKLCRHAINSVVGILDVYPGTIIKVQNAATNERHRHDLIVNRTRKT